MRRNERKAYIVPETPNRQRQFFGHVTSYYIHAEQFEWNCLSQVKPVKICGKKVDHGRGKNPFSKMQDFPYKLSRQVKPLFDIGQQKIAPDHPNRRSEEPAKNQRPYCRTKIGKQNERGRANE